MADPNLHRVRSLDQRPFRDRWLSLHPSVAVLVQSPYESSVPSCWRRLRCQHVAACAKIEGRRYSRSAEAMLPPVK